MGFISAKTVRKEGNVVSFLVHNFTEINVTGAHGVISCVEIIWLSSAHKEILYFQISFHQGRAMFSNFVALSQVPASGILIEFELSAMKCLFVRSEKHGSLFSGTPCIFLFEPSLLLHASNDCERCFSVGS